MMYLDISSKLNSVWLDAERLLGELKLLERNGLRLLGVVASGVFCGVDLRPAMTSFSEEDDVCKGDICAPLLL